VNENVTSVGAAQFIPRSWHILLMLSWADALPEGNPLQ
jgi:hypothetical protein